MVNLHLAALTPRRAGETARCVRGCTLSHVPIRGSETRSWVSFLGGHYGGRTGGVPRLPVHPSLPSPPCHANDTPTALMGPPEPQARCQWVPIPAPLRACMLRRVPSAGPPSGSPWRGFLGGPLFMGPLFRPSIGCRPLLNVPPKCGPPVGFLEIFQRCYIVDLGGRSNAARR